MSVDLPEIRWCMGDQLDDRFELFRAPAKCHGRAEIDPGFASGLVGEAVEAAGQLDIGSRAEALAGITAGCGA